MKYVFALAIIMLTVAAIAGEFKYIPDHPGVNNVIAGKENTADYHLAAADAARFNANLDRLRELLLDQPNVKSPVGFKLDGNLRADFELPKEKGAPIPVLGHIYSQPCMEDWKTGKPVFFAYSTDEMFVRVNKPVSILDHYATTDDGVEFILEPKRTGDVDGFPVFRTAGGDEVIVLSRNGELPWMPVSVEEFTNYWINEWQKQADASAADILSPQIIKGHKDGLAKMTQAERQSQARFYQQDIYPPPVAPMGSDLGQPIIKVNPKWRDPALPRTALQLIVIRFVYSNSLDPDHPAPTKTGSISALRLHEYLHSADWKAIAAGVLTDR